MASWRPTLGLITAGLIVGVLMLPLSGLVFFRLYENQLVRQTEAELIAQSAAMAAVFGRAIEAAGSGAFPIGPPRPPTPTLDPEGRFAPITPALDLARAPILARRPDPLPAPALTPAARAVGDTLEALSAETQRTTLAGFRFLDADGVVVGGATEVGGSLAHVEEIKDALGGRFRAVLRTREPEDPDPPLYSISRGTRIRIFVAMPVIVENRVRRVVYLSRTPQNILQHLYREAGSVSQAGLLMLAGAALIGLAFVRTISRPVRMLAGRANAIARGDRSAIGPLAQHGAQEIADLTQSIMDLARRLSERSDYLATFAAHVTHELKTPLAAIRGAAELLADPEAQAAPEQRARFLEIVLVDIDRMAALLDRLRELARAENPALGGQTTLAAVLDALAPRLEDLAIARAGDLEAALGMSHENAAIVLGHLLDNARRHGTRQVEIIAWRNEETVLVSVRDDGEGIAPANRARIFEPFFTTRRASGGTGLGLGIARALMTAHCGDIALADSDTGAAFALAFPSPPASPPPRPRRAGLGGLVAAAARFLRRDS